MKLAIILLTLVLLLSFGLLILAARIQNLKKRLASQHRQASLGSFLEGLLVELKIPLDLITKNLDNLRSQVALLQEFLVQLRLKAALPPPEEEDLAKILGEESLESRLSQLDTLMNTLETRTHESLGSLEIIHKLSQTEKDKAAPLDFPELLSKIVTFLGPKMEGKILVHTEYAPLPPLLVQGGLLFQIVLLLMETSIQPMTEGGHLYLTLTSEDTQAVLDIQGERSVSFSTQEWDLLKTLLGQVRARLLHTTQNEGNQFRLKIPSSLAKP